MKSEEHSLIHSQTANKIMRNEDLWTISHLCWVSGYNIITMSENASLVCESSHFNTLSSALFMQHKTDRMAGMSFYGRLKGEVY